MQAIGRRLWELAHKLAGYPPESAWESRPMKFPYTFTAKLVQFPYRQHWQNWAFRYYVYGVFGSLPVFAFISYKSNSPGNVAAWAEIKRKEAEKHRQRVNLRVNETLETTASESNSVPESNSESEYNLESESTPESET